MGHIVNTISVIWPLIGVTIPLLISCSVAGILLRISIVEDCGILPAVLYKLPCDAAWHSGHQFFKQCAPLQVKTKDVPAEQIHCHHAVTSISATVLTTIAARTTQLPSLIERQCGRDQQP